jgi:hypothetical protein
MLYQDQLQVCSRGQNIASYLRCLAEGGGINLQKRWTCWTAAGIEGVGVGSVEETVITLAECYIVPWCHDDAG